MLCFVAVGLASTALAQAPGSVAGQAQPTTVQAPSQSAPMVSPGVSETTAGGVSSSKSYHVELNFSSGKISLKEIDLTDTSAPERVNQPLVGWRCEVLASGNVVENSFLFDIPITTCSDVPGKDAGLTGGCVSKDKSSFSIDVPYFENGIGIALIRPDGKSYYINTIGFAKLCGDNICESSENYSTCSKDCRSGVRDSYCDGVADGSCDPDCFILADHGVGEDSDCRGTGQSASGTEMAWWIVGGLALVLVIGIFVARKKK